MSSIELREKSSDDLHTWLAVMWDEVSKGSSRAGNSPEDAEANIERNRSHFSSVMRLADGQFVFERAARRREGSATLWLGGQIGNRLVDLRHRR